MDLQIRQQSSRHASDERARSGNGGRHQAGDRRPLRSADFPVEPAWLRHRHAEPNPLRRRRVLHAVGADPVDAGAGRLDQRLGLRVSGLRHGMEGDGRRSRRLCARADRQGQSRRHGQDLGQRLPPDHDLDQTDSDAGRFQRHEVARAAVAAVDLDVQGASTPRRPRSTSTRSIRRCRPRSSTARKIRWRSSPRRSSTKCRNTAR